MKSIAVIGSGAAGLGVLEALSRKPGCHVDLFDTGPAPSNALRPVGHPETWSNSEMARIYASVKQAGARGVPLPKSHFGEVPARVNVGGRPRIWRSQFEGGLTNFWGGTLLPFRQPDIRNWPFTEQDLAPYYSHLALRIGITGADDGLSRLFSAELVTRPEISAHPRIRSFARKLDAVEISGINIAAGSNRTALDTRPDADTSCVNCGECMIGCFRDATFSTSKLLGDHHSRGLIKRHVRGSVRAIEPDAGIVVVSSSESNETTEFGPYEHVFLAAGCMGTTEIVLRSTGDTGAIEIGDSYSVNVPVVAWGRERVSSADYFGLANALVVMTDKETGATLGQAQIYPTVNHFWRSVVPSPFWPVARVCAIPMQQRLLWLRMYLPDRYANRYRLQFDGSEVLRATMSPPDGAPDAARRLVDVIQTALRGSGYAVLGSLQSAGGTSSHYAASLADRERFGIGADSRWGNRAFICDSSIWPEVPVQSPTFTIMANAMRIAENAV